MREEERIERELEKAVDKVIKNKLSRVESLRKGKLKDVNKELRKIAREISMYCGDTKECEKYIYAMFRKYRPRDVIKLIEISLSENKDVLEELKKFISSEDIEITENQVHTKHAIIIVKKFLRKILHGK